MRFDLTIAGDFKGYGGGCGGGHAWGLSQGLWQLYRIPRHCQMILAVTCWFRKSIDLIFVFRVAMATFVAIMRT